MEIRRFPMLKSDEELCVPKTSSALISGGNQATSLVHVQTILLCFGYFGRGIQVEEPA